MFFKHDEVLKISNRLLRFQKNTGFLFARLKVINFRVFRLDYVRKIIYLV